MKLNRRNIENIFAICVLTVFTGQIYINPFLQWFRFSFAVVTLSLLLIYFKDVSVPLVSFIIAILMFAFRGFVHYTSYGDMTFMNTLLLYLPVVTFYLVFGLIFEALDVRKKLNNPVAFILSLWISDSMGNWVEAIVRSFFTSFNFDRATFLIIVVGFFRSIFIYLLYLISSYYKKRFDNDREESKYKELLLFISKLKTELFFLRKSKKDIEDTMAKSYLIYEKVHNVELKEEALSVAKNIHEVKKDYQRVIAGMENILLEGNNKIHMKISEVLEIIKDNTIKLIENKSKKISLKIDVNNDFLIDDYYPIISILNNLIVNSIEAMDSIGNISIIEKAEKEKIIFKVMDDGEGIEEDDLDIIFEPGFSTKFNRLTGSLSTGIGLYHAKEIVEKHYRGRITVESIKGRYTRFYIIIPTKKIESRK